MMLPVTLVTSAGAALLALWLGMRIVQVRRRAGIAHGHGESALLARRMRAQLNFAEYTPVVLILVAAIELAGKGGLWLAAIAAAFLGGRLAHALGMDAERPPVSRTAGTAITFASLGVLAAVALATALRWL